MTSAFSWQNAISLCPASFQCSKAKFACYSRYFLTSCFCIPFPSKEKEGKICFPNIIMFNFCISHTHTHAFYPVTLIGLIEYYAFLSHLLQYSYLENPMDGWRILVGYSLWGCKESDTTESLNFYLTFNAS